MTTVNSVLQRAAPNNIFPRPMITPDQRAENRGCHKIIQRQLVQKRKAKNLRQGKFHIDLRSWIKSGLIEPGVNVLKYKDIEGANHRASILPNGKLQADEEDGPVYCSIRAWIKVVSGIRGPAIQQRLEWETKRVTYEHKPMSFWFKISRDREEIEVSEK